MIKSTTWMASLMTVLMLGGNGWAQLGSFPFPAPINSIAIAPSDSNTIYVGAGRYGDVSGTGTFTGPGDEHA